nr:aldehyde dehydrogenase family protein [Mycobacterium sp. SMC-8]
MVLKPSEQTPLTALLIGELALEAGIPPGVLNVIPGLGPVAGAGLAEHPMVDKVVFTGGTEVGRIISVATASRFAKSTVELGGKTPVLVFDDVPTEVSARGAAFGGFVGAGQTCIAGTESWCRKPYTTISWPRWRPRPNESGSVIRVKRRPSLARSSPNVPASAS